MQTRQGAEAEARELRLGKVFLRSSGGEQILAKVLDVLHVGVHDVEAVLEDKCVRPLEGAERGQHQPLVIEVIETVFPAFARRVLPGDIARRLHPDHSHAGRARTVEEGAQVSKRAPPSQGAPGTQVEPTRGRNCDHRNVEPARIDCRFETFPRVLMRAEPQMGHLAGPFRL